MRKTRAIGRSAGGGSPVYLSPSFAPRRDLPALRSERTVLVARGRARRSSSLSIDRDGREREREGGYEGTAIGRARREEKRRDEKRRDGTSRDEAREGKEAGKKGKATPQATRTGHARLSTRHLRVPRKPGEKERKREGKRVVPMVDSRHRVAVRDMRRRRRRCR